MYRSESTDIDNATWSYTQKILFRFCFLTISSFILLFNNGSFFFVGIIKGWIDKIIYPLVPWFAENILHYSYDHTVRINGSGDTSFAWILLSILLALSTLGTLLWSILDRKRLNYEKLYYWLHVLVRYYVAFTLIQYGMIKVIKLQFPDASLSRATQMLGDFSPMGLAWTFLGFSKGYNLFMGIAELLSGLLLFRRTVLIGAVISLGTSLNIMAINYFYDVPVKMLSTALAILSLFLITPHVKELYHFFIRLVPTQLKLLQKPSFQKKWINVSLNLLKIVILLSFGISQVISIQNSKKAMAAYFGNKSPLYGIYIPQFETEQFIIPIHWNKIIFEHTNKVYVRDRTEKINQYSCQIDESKKEINIVVNDASIYKFRYSTQTNGDLILIGTDKDKDIVQSILLKKKQPNEIELLNRPFRWINEYPHNL